MDLVVVAQVLENYTLPYQDVVVGDVMELSPLDFDRFTQLSISKVVSFPRYSTLFQTLIPLKASTLVQSNCDCSEEKT